MQRKRRHGGPASNYFQIIKGIGEPLNDRETTNTVMQVNPQCDQYDSEVQQRQIKEKQSESERQKRVKEAKRYEEMKMALRH